MIKINNDNNKKLKTIIDKRLSSFNKEHCQWFKKLDLIKGYEEKEYNFIAYDGEKLIGGATGFIKYKWYFLDMLFVDEQYRKKGIGSKLISCIEELAKKENLLGVRIETWDFQAREFYEKNGYEVYAEFDDCPPGTVDYFLKKRF